MNDFVFNYIFEQVKDRGFSNALQFRVYLFKKYGIDDRYRQDITRLYVDINRYQVKKYGRSVNPNQYIDLSKETLRRKGKSRYSVKQHRLRKK